MQRQKTPPSPETVKITAALLAEKLGGSVRLGEGRNLGGSARSNVYRFPLVAGPAQAPSSIIVKQTDSAIAATLFNEWAALQFLSEVCADEPLAPRFYAGNRDAGLFIMEDFGEGKRLDHILLSNDPDVAEKALLDFASIHGRLHARTYRRQAEYMNIRQALGSVEEVQLQLSYEELAKTLSIIARSVEIEITPGVESELAELARAMEHPEGFETFIQGDSCPDNCVYLDGKLHMLDFEFSRFTHALLEGCYVRLPFPSCWCVYAIPERIMQRMETTYRTELAQSCPAQ